MDKDSSQQNENSIDNLLKIATFAKIITEIIFYICKIVNQWF